MRTQRPDYLAFREYAEQCLNNIESERLKVLASYAPITELESILEALDVIKHHARELIEHPTENRFIALVRALDDKHAQLSTELARRGR